MIAVRLSRRRSWHLCPSAASPRTLCGRTLPTVFDARAEFPGDEKTCERCAVIAAKLGLPVGTIDDDPLAGTVAPI